MVDQLAQEYAGQPVLFLEQAVDNPLGDRYGRWWTAYPGSGSATLPFMMVDSGNQISNGYVNFYNTYKSMVDTALARPAKADIVAYYQRIGDKLAFDVTVTNQSGVTLSWSNSATIHAIAYEEAHIALTDRYVRAAVSTPISTPLVHGDSAHFTLTTGDITGVNWANMRSVVLVDYRPVASGAYDTLQAALPELAQFAVAPQAISFLVDPQDQLAEPVPLSFSGPSTLDWDATNTLSWLTVTPISGTISSPPTLSVIVGSLSPGWQQGQLTFNATDHNTLQFVEQVPVSAYYGPVERLYLPVIAK